MDIPYPHMKSNEGQNKSISTIVRDIDEKGDCSSYDVRKFFNLIKTMNGEELLKELMIKKYKRGLQLLAVHHILTGPDIYPVEDLTLILEPIREIHYLTYYEYLQQAMNTIFRNKSLEEAYKTIHTVYGRFPEIEDQLVILYSVAVLEHEVFNNGDEGDVTEKKLKICSRVKTEISNIGCKRKMNIIQGLVKKSLIWLPRLDPRLSNVILIILVIHHELFTQHSSSDESEEYPLLTKKLMAILNNFFPNTRRCLPYYFETCFDRQTTSKEQCISILGNVFDSNPSYTRKIKVEFFKHLLRKVSPEMLKCNEFKVLRFIVKFSELEWSFMEREINIQMKIELESILTSADTTHPTEMLMKYTQEFASKGAQVYIALITCHILVKRRKHEKLAVVTKCQDAITHRLQPDLLRFYCKKCLPKLNPKEKVEWIHKHYDEQQPVIGVLLKVGVYIELLLMKEYHVSPKEMSLVDDKNILQPIFIHKGFLHPTIRADIELVSFIINKKAISNELLIELSCDKLRAYIILLLHLYAKENKPEIGQVLKDVVQLSIRKFGCCTDSFQMCQCQHTRAAAFHKLEYHFVVPYYHTPIWRKPSDLQSYIQYMYEKQHLPSIEDIKTIWGNLLITDDITEPILDHFINLMIMACKKQDIAKLVLDIDISKCKYSNKIITLISSVLKIEENVKHDKFIYKCYCIVRHHNRVDHAHDKAISTYREVFPFLKAMEANDEMEKLSTFRTIAVFLILLVLSSALGQTSSQLKKYLALKYEYEDAILYLLWCSGDVEINPGPTLKKLRKVPDSQKERSWVYDTCSTLLKVINGCNLETKTDGLWKEAPRNWPTDQPFYDPRNKPKGGYYTSSSDERLIKNLFEFCKQIGKQMPQNFQNEFNAWMRGSKTDLFQQYISRAESKTLLEAVQDLTQYKDDNDLKKHLQERKIHIIFSTQVQSSKPAKQYPDIVRDLATTFCRLCKKLPLTDKSDGIWKNHPLGWNPQHKYYSPCNAGIRTEKNQDSQLLDNLITCCKSMQRDLPQGLELIVGARKSENSEEVYKQYTIWANVCIIDHSLEYLWIEGYLDTPHVQQCLDKIGINISTEKKQEYLRKHPPKPIEQPKTAIGASSSIVQNDTETPSTSSYNKGSLNDREVNSVDSSAVKSVLISSACEDVSMVVPDPLDQSAKTQERKSVKRKNKITEDQEPAKKVATSSVQVSFVKNPTNVKDDTSKSTVSVLDSPTHTTTSEDDNSKTDNKYSSNIQQINQMVEKTSSNDTDQNNGSPDSANSSLTIHKDSSQDERLTPKQDPPENSKNKPEKSSSGTVMNSLFDTNKCTNIPNDTTIDDMDVDKIQNQLNALNNDLSPDFDEDLDTYLNSHNLQDIVFTLLGDDL